MNIKNSPISLRDGDHVAVKVRNYTHIHTHIKNDKERRGEEE